MRCWKGRNVQNVHISEMAGFQFAGAELDMTESTVGDAL